MIKVDDNQNDLLQLLPSVNEIIHYGENEQDYTTNLYSGMWHAKDRFGPLDCRFGPLKSSRPKALIFLSDGRHTDGDESPAPPPDGVPEMIDIINDYYATPCISIYSLRCEAYLWYFENNTWNEHMRELQDPSRLRSISNMRNLVHQKGGKFHQVNHLKQFSPLFNDILSNIRKKASVENKTGFQGGEDPVITQFLIEDNAQKLTAFLSYEPYRFDEDRARLTLISPDNFEYDSTGPPGDEWRYLNRIDVDEPDPGLWTAEFYPTSEEEFFPHLMSLDISVDSDLNVSIDNYPPWRLNSDPFDIEVEVKELNTPITDADVWVEVVIPGEQEYNIPLIHDNNNEGRYRFSFAAYPYDGHITFNKYIDIDSHNAQRRSSHTVYFEEDEIINVICINILELPDDLYYEDPLGFEVEIADVFGPITYADVWVEIDIDGPDPYNAEVDLIHDEQSEGNYTAEFIPDPHTGHASVLFCIYLPHYDSFISEELEVLVYGD